MPRWGSAVAACGGTMVPMRRRRIVAAVTVLVGLVLLTPGPLSAPGPHLPTAAAADVPAAPFAPVRSATLPVPPLFDTARDRLLATAATVDHVTAPPLPPSAPVVAVPRAAQCPQWWSLAARLGWPLDALEDLDVVLYRESRCQPGVWNREDPNGGSRGLLQVNGSWTKWLRDRSILADVEDLYDPVVNLRAGVAIYEYGIDRYGFGWGPWGFDYVAPSQR